MKKLLVIVLALVLIVGCVSIFAACSDKDGDFKVGVLHINPVDSTSGYTFAHQQGIKEMIAELDLTKDQIIYKDNLVDTDNAKISAAIEELIADGCKFIIGTSFGYMDEMQKAAEKYPNIIFTHGTGFKDTMGEGKNNNMNNYFGRIYQARYLSGMVAGAKTTTNKLGYVVAHGTTIAECTSGVNAFTLGAKAVNPDAEVYVKVLNSWYDPTNESAFAITLLEQGCDVITQHCDTENPSSEAKKASLFSVGYNSDMAVAVGENGERDASVLTSVLWHWGAYYKLAGVAAKSCFDGGKFVSNNPWIAFGNYYGSISDDLYGLSQFSSVVDTDTISKVNLVKNMMKSGVTEWDVFTDVALSFEKIEGAWTVVKTDRILKNNQNNSVGNIGVAEITGNMAWWVDGVTVLA